MFVKKPMAFVSAVAGPAFAVAAHSAAIEIRSKRQKSR